MLQRIGLAQALVGRPKCLFLDEPTSGMDPEGALQARARILEPKTGSFQREQMSIVSAVEAPDPATATIRLKTAFSPFLSVAQLKFEQPAPLFGCWCCCCHHQTPLTRGRENPETKGWQGLKAAGLAAACSHAVVTAIAAPHRAA